MSDTWSYKSCKGCGKHMELYIPEDLCRDCERAEADKHSRSYDGPIAPDDGWDQWADADIEDEEEEE